MQYRVIQKIEIILGSRKFKKPSKTAVVLIAGVTISGTPCPRHIIVPFVKFKKPSKTAVVLIAGVTISGTPCPRHIIVPFGAEALSGHAAQAWAIPPPSWGLLSQWHRQQTTTPETNGASPARTQRHS